MIDVELDPERGAAVEIRGAVALERGERGLLPRRVRADQWSRIPDDFMLASVSQCAGVRLAFRTAATAIELTVNDTKMVADDEVPLPPGGYELVELGWDEMTDSAIALVEWPERADDALKPEHLDIRLDFAPGGQGRGRIAMLTGTGAFASRLQRMKAYRNLVERCGWGDARRYPMTADASVIRSYERLVKPDGSTALLMISPPRPVGPAVRRGKPYTTIAKLAEVIGARRN